MPIYNDSYNNYYFYSNDYYNHYNHHNYCNDQNYHYPRMCCIGWKGTR